jgi:RNA recognition motif-containing protein
MSKFCRWRLNNKSFDMMLFADEVSNLAPVQFDSGTGADTSVSSASLAQTIKKVRKRRTSWLLGSQKFSEVNPNVRAEANYVLFWELPQAQDKSRSQTDIVLDALQLKAGDGFKKMIRDMIEGGAFPEKEFIWFKHDKNARDLQVIKPNVPYFMLYQRDLTMREIFRAYEKWMADLKESDSKEDQALFEYYAKTVGEKVLLKSWRDVPILEYPDDTFNS